MEKYIIDYDGKLDVWVEESGMSGARTRLSCTQISSTVASAAGGFLVVLFQYGF